MTKNDVLNKLEQETKVAWSKNKGISGLVDGINSAECIESGFLYS